MNERIFASFHRSQNLVRFCLFNRDSGDFTSLFPHKGLLPVLHATCSQSRSTLTLEKRNLILNANIASVFIHMGSIDEVKPIFANNFCVYKKYFHFITTVFVPIGWHKLLSNILRCPAPIENLKVFFRTKFCQDFFGKF